MPLPLGTFRHVSRPRALAEPASRTRPISATSAAHGISCKPGLNPKAVIVLFIASHTCTTTGYEPFYLGRSATSAGPAHWLNLV